MHDVLDPRDLVPDEAEQLAHSGYKAEGLLEESRRAAQDDDFVTLERIARDLTTLRIASDWAYEEPDDESTVKEIAIGAPVLPIRESQLRDRLKGAWLGRAVGNTMGKPVEGLSRREVELYLRAGRDWPQTGYVRLVEPQPEGLSWLHPDAPISSLGTFTDVPRDDDIDWTILGLYMLEKYGRKLTTGDIAREWLDRLPFTQTFTAERAAYRNVLLGKTGAETATFDNPYREWIGALIRADIFGYVYPGDPASAALAALVDARLSHVKNGLYAELWAAALVSTAFATDDARTALTNSIAVVPRGSRLYEAIEAMLELHETGVGHTVALDRIDETVGHYNWVHTVNNASIIAAGLLWGTTFTDTLAKTIAGGNDTDSNGATVGSVYGALHGSNSVPEELVGSTHVHVRSAVRGFDRITIDELTDRTFTVRESLRSAQ